MQPPGDRAVLTPEPIKTSEEQVEVIKVSGFVPCLFFYFFPERVRVLYFGVYYLLSQVYLEARKQDQQKHQESLKMLSDEVSQIQEVSIYHSR